ncbi:MAG: DUF3035 domain-containing protein [Alphaproteobacteria bacterium]
MSIPGGTLAGTGRVAALVALALALAVGACSNIRDQLGLGKNPPDEFKVVTRAPLSLPPDFSLRPPAPGTKRPQEETAQERVKVALYGKLSPAVDDGSRSTGEQALLAHAGTAKAQPNIRRLINDENLLYADEDSSFVDALIFWHDKTPTGTIVDPAKEAQRLQEASALGKPPTEGETAIIKRRKKAILEGIF